MAVSRDTLSRHQTTPFGEIRHFLFILFITVLKFQRTWVIFEVQQSSRSQLLDHDLRKSPRQIGHGGYLYARLLISSQIRLAGREMTK